MEVPTKHKVPSLDVLVHKLPSGMLKTSVYQKRHERGYSYPRQQQQSNQPQRSGVKALFGRVTTHSSDAETRRLEKAYLLQLLTDSIYPLNFMKPTIPLPPGANSEVNLRIWRSIPYLQGISELVARQLRPYIFNLEHKPTQSLWGTLLRLRRRDFQHRSNGMWCTRCNALNVPGLTWAKPVGNSTHV